MIKLTSESNLATIEEISKNVFRLKKNFGFLDLGKDKAGNDNRFKDICNLSFDLYEKLNKRHKFERYEENENLWYIFVLPIVNAEQHGNEWDINKITRIKYEIQKYNSNMDLTVKVKDEGNGFDYNHIIEAERIARGTSANYNNFRIKEKENSVGNGIFYILRYADNVNWNKKVNEIKITKYLKLL